MISLPSTPRLIEVMRTEVLEVLAPEVTSDQAKVSVAMLENLFRNLAARAGHEIAWMREECDVIDAFAADVLEAHPDAAELAGALAAYRENRTPSLHLDDVQKDYDRASEALSCAVEAALPHGGELKDRAVGLLQQRLARETEIMGEFGFVGRG